MPEESEVLTEEKDSLSAPNEASQTRGNQKNQNLLLSMVLGAVALFLVLLILSHQQKNPGDTSSHESDLEGLQKELDAKKREAEQLRYTLQNPSLQNPTTLLESIQRDTQILADLASHQTNHAAELRAANQALLASQEKNRTLETKLSSYRNGSTNPAELEAQVSELQKRLNTSVEATVVDSMRNELLQTKEKNEELTSEIGQFKDQFQILKSENEILRGELDALKALQKEK